jgi:penicillin amidase
VNGEFAPPYRERQIRALLSAKKRFGPDDMLGIQKDVYSSLSHFIAKQAVAAFDKRASKNESLKAAAEALRGWNGQMEKDQAEPVIAALIYEQLRVAIGNRASNGKANIWEGTMVGPIIERLLRDRPAEWFGDYDQLVLRCFVEALEVGRKLQGRDPEKWKYGRYLEITMRHPVFGQADWLKYVPTLGKYFRINVGPAPMSGSATTVKATTPRLGVSMRFVADLANWDNSRMNVTLGQSGQLFSSHYSDQWENYYVGKSFNLPFTKPDGSTLEFTPRR